MGASSKLFRTPCLHRRRGGRRGGGEGGEFRIIEAAILSESLLGNQLPRQLSPQIKNTQELDTAKKRLVV